MSLYPLAAGKHQWHKGWKDAGPSRQWLVFWHISGLFGASNANNTCWSSNWMPINVGHQWLRLHHPHHFKHNAHPTATLHFILAWDRHWVMPYCKPHGLVGYAFII